MKEQHTLIKGYRDLSFADISLINKIKEHEAAGTALIKEVGDHLAAQNTAAAGDNNEKARLSMAEPQRWLAMARSDLQVGHMKLVRAVAQPGT